MRVSHLVSQQKPYRDILVRTICAGCGRRFWAQRRSAITCSDICRQARSRLLRATTPPLPEGPFDLIVGDSPLSYVTRSPKGQGRSPGAKYQTMDLPALRRLYAEVGKRAAPNAGLGMWVYGPRLPDALTLIDAAGFVFNSDLLNWLKIAENGQPRMGTGYTTRKTNEQMIYAIRGKGLTVVDHSVRQGFLAPRAEHSEKPDIAMESLERLFGPVRRLELFARKRRAGWTPWGNQVPPLPTDDEPDDET